MRNGEIIRDAALGAAFGEIFKGFFRGITCVIRRTIQFQSNLEGLRTTLSRLQVFVQDIRQSHEELGGEINGLVELMEKGEKLVNECSNLKWWQHCIRFFYAHKLWKLDKELLVFLQIDIMARIMRNSSTTVNMVSEIRERLNRTETSTIDIEVEVTANHEDLAAVREEDKMS
ncbi:hypothetical protein F2P56_037033 [Juglans regia]|uniref:Uncharacterized protein LOC108983862 n=2 Tax=Juglans regia TaxID=51240 RepID=A0A2I4DVL1_JUGRE|nr:uncharacterized protein LOC108983862 [Juglans regia]XP_018811182.1 uncharacterized protein LOC108983862 [Juglans regia]XP_035548037.1 uncharacterized protein LOC118349015 [Juglans regia]XP_035548038.1 uncharacterized protein LOC118349015 [Juglans regia]KAF5442093.1 hypothetical protein F2P56_037033 [Juglans regia]